MPEPERPHFFYGRVSSEDQAEDGTIESQQYDLHQWQADRERLWIAGEFWDDPASGTLLLEDRPAALEMIEAIRAVSNLRPVLVITRMSRITRGDIWVYACAMRTLASLNCTLISLVEQFDSSPQGEFIRDMHASVARLHRATILQEMTKGRDRKVRASNWTCGPVPFGYTTSQSCGPLEPSELVAEGTGFTEAELAASVFHHFAYEGASTISEARRLNAMHISTARRYGNGKIVDRGKTWLPSRVRAMVMSSTYKGTHVYKSRMGVIRREVPALVDEETWKLANRNMQRNKALSKRNARENHLLRGLMRCGNCGAGYAFTYTHRRTGPPEGYYRCNAQIGSINPEAAHRCLGRMVAAIPLEDYVWSKIREFAADPQETLALAQAELRRRLGTVAEHANREAELRRAIAGKEAERKQAREQNRRRLITFEELQEDLETITAETSALRGELDNMRNERELAEDQEQALTNAATMLRRAQDSVEEISRTNDVDRKRAVIERLVSNIIVTTEVVSIDKDGRRRKRATIDVNFYFGQRANHSIVVTSGTATDNNAITLLHRLAVGADAAVAA